MATIQERVDAEPFWFHRMDLGDGVITPGRSGAATAKLPYFGLPDDMSGMRVLDVAAAEGFFSFEAERRGASEVVAIDFDPRILRRFAICADALGSKISPLQMSVYDLDPDALGTFDLVMCFGLLYHLRHPLLGLEKVAAMTGGMLLVQSLTLELLYYPDLPLARFRPDGIMSSFGGNASLRDRSVYWEPNAACMRDMLVHLGMVDIEHLNPAGPQPLRTRLVRTLRRSKYATWNSSAAFRARSASDRRDTGLLDQMPPSLAKLEPNG